MSVDITPVAGKNTVEYDFILWLVATALKADNSPNFVDGENASADQVAGTLHLFDHYLEDKPDDVGVVRVLRTQPLDGGATPIRVADMAMLIRMGEPTDPALAGAKDRAMAAAQAVLQTLQTPDMRFLSQQQISTGRHILSFTNPRISPGSMDASNRFEVLVEFIAMYQDSITQ